MFRLRRFGVSKNEFLPELRRNDGRERVRNGQRKTEGTRAVYYTGSENAEQA